MASCVANKVVSEVEDLLLAHGVAGQANLQYRNGGSGIDDDQRRRCAWGQESQECLRDRGGLCQSGLYIGAWLEEYFDDRDAAERLRFNMFDVVDKRRYATLDGGRDALLHFLWLQTVVRPNEADNGNIDVRKNVGRRAQQHDRRQENDDQRHHDEGVGSGKR